MSGLEVENITAELGLQGIEEINGIFGWIGIQNGDYRGLMR